MKMKYLIALCVMLGMLTARAQQQQVTCGKLHEIKQFESKYVQPRDVYVWTPDGYDPSKKYAVLYMHDGQMLFDASTSWNRQEWQVDEICGELQRQGKLQDMIVVGIANVGDMRFYDYCPQKILNDVPQQLLDSANYDRSKFDADGYLKFIVKELKPYIDRNYATHRDRRHTFVMGSSMGGLISLYAICEYPKVFGGAACLSTHTPISVKFDSSRAEFEVWAAAFAKYLSKNLPKANSRKIYMDRGDQTLDANYTEPQQAIDDIFKAKGWTERWWTSRLFVGAAHTERDWAARLHLPLTFLLGNGTSSQPADDALLYPVPVYRNGTEGYSCFRIPSLVRANNGDLLAFAEGRKNSCSDTGNIDIVMKRSTDNGLTWGPTRLIYDAGDNVCGNECPIVIPGSDRIVMVLCGNRGEDTEPQIIDGTSKDTRHVYVMTSDDNGATWTTPKEITPSVKRADWTWYATGPCHGIVKRHEPHKGRLVVGMNFMVAGTKAFHSGIIYSDDLGETWSLGAVQRESGGNESTVAELADGSIIQNMRNYDRDGHPCRSITISRDGGHTLSATRFATELIEPVCQGSMIRGEGDAAPLVFCNPNSTTQRERLALHISHDGGATWQASNVVYGGQAAYSDITIMGDGYGVLFEYGDDSPYESIGFKKVKAPSPVVTSHTLTLP